MGTTSLWARGHTSGVQAGAAGDVDLLTHVL